MRILALLSLLVAGAAAFGKSMALFFTTATSYMQETQTLHRKVEFFEAGMVALH
jgi:hypothetical protein